MNEAHMSQPPYYSLVDTRLRQSIITYNSLFVVVFVFASVRCIANAAPSDWPSGAAYAPFIPLPSLPTGVNGSRS